MITTVANVNEVNLVRIQVKTIDEAFGRLNELKLNVLYRIRGNFSTVQRNVKNDLPLPSSGFSLEPYLDFLGSANNIRHV